MNYALVLNDNLLVVDKQTGCGRHTGRWLMGIVAIILLIARPMFVANYSAVRPGVPLGTRRGEIDGFIASLRWQRHN